MRVLVQRAKDAKCVVNKKITGEIDQGLVIFVGFTETDNKDTIIKMVNKIINLRIFPDENEVMNLYKKYYLFPNLLYMQIQQKVIDLVI